MSTESGGSEEAERHRAERAAMLRPRPLNSLVASAQRITDKTVKERRGFGKPEGWQDDAWEMYDLVGELRFLSNTLANRISQAKLYVGKVSDDPLERPEPLDDEANQDNVAVRAFGYFGGSDGQRSQMIARMATNLFVTGDGWLVGVPREILPDDMATPHSGTPANEPATGDELALDDLEWRMLSVSEVASDGDQITLQLGEGKSAKISVNPDKIWMIRVWRPHPRKWWEADSPTRSSLPVLRELVGLTMHVSAQVDSRLAGAGVFVIPESAKRSIAVATGIDPDLDDDPFTEALMDAMMTAIGDRSSAAALVPLVITVPDEAAGIFQHLTFSTPLDSEARELRDEAIRRYALGSDAPPELLLGTAGMSHWGGWIVREDTITTHVEPPLALICDAITTQYLWPVLIEQGMSEEEAHDYVVWYDVSHLVQRPNRLADASTLYDKGVLSDEALREAGGFGDADAPTSLGRPVEIAIEMARSNPALIDNMKEIVAAFDEILNPTETNVATLPDAPEAGEDVTAEENVPGEDGPPSDESLNEAEPEPSRDSEPEPSTTAAASPLKAITRSWADLPQVTEADIAETNSPFMRAFLTDIRSQQLADGHDSNDWDDDRDDWTEDAVHHVALVALPTDTDPINGYGPEEKHVTVVYLEVPREWAGEADGIRAEMRQILRSAASGVEPFMAEPARYGELGEQGARVVHLQGDDLPTLRNQLLSDPELAEWYSRSTATKYPEYQPHLTLGYPDEGEEEDRDQEWEGAAALPAVWFDRLALWWDDYHEEFPLRDRVETEAKEAQRRRKLGQQLEEVLE